MNKKSHEFDLTVAEQAKNDAKHGYAPQLPLNTIYMLTYNWALKSTQANGVK